MESTSVTWKYKIDSRIIIFTIMAFVFAIVVDFIYTKNYWMDVNHYWFNINDWYQYGKIPYKDYTFEYPPFALIIFLIPRLFSADLNSFHYAFALFAIVSYFAMSYLLLDLCRNDRKTYYAVAFLLIITPLFAIKFIVTRNDIFAAVLVVIAYWLFKKDHRYLAYVLIALAAMIKIYPIFFIIGFATYHVSKKDWRNLINCIATISSVCIMCELPFLILDPHSAFSYLSYHSEREIQIESVVASFMYAAYFMGHTDLYYIESHGSDNMLGDLPNLIAPHMNQMMFVAIATFSLLIFYILYVHHRSKGRIDAEYCVYLVSTIVILLFIIFSKVYSAQYMIWILLLLPILIIYSKSDKERLFFIVLICIFGTISACAAHYYTSLEIYLWLAELEAIKNALTVALLAFTVYLLYAHTKSPDDTRNLKRLRSFRK